MLIPNCYSNREKKKFLLNLQLLLCSDLSRNAMIVPLKILQGYHGNSSSGSANNSVVAITFHPRQPWIASAGMDGVINLFQDI